MIDVLNLKASDTIIILLYENIVYNTCNVCNRCPEETICLNVLIKIKLLWLKLCCSVKVERIVHKSLPQMMHFPTYFSFKLLNNARDISLSFMLHNFHS